MKKTILFLLIILLMIGACGCMWNITEKSNKEDLANDMVQYMNDKYTDDIFTYKGVFGGGAGADTKTIIVSSKNYPDKDIYVRRSFNDGDIYTDNYMGVRYATHTELIIKAALDNVISYDYLLFYEVDRYACPNAVGVLSFEEYIASRESYIGFTVVVNGAVSDKESFENNLREILVDSGICCSATIYFDNGSGAFDTLDKEGLSGYTFKKLYSDVFSFEMSSNKEFSVLRWGD